MNKWGIISTIYGCFNIQKSVGYSLLTNKGEIMMIFTSAVEYVKKSFIY